MQDYKTDSPFIAGWLNDGFRNYEGDPSKGNFFAHTWDMDQNNLASYDPFVQGYAYIFWTRLPKFFDVKVASAFKNMTEKNFKSLSGIGDMTLDTEEVTGGFTGNEYSVATNLKKTEGSFQLKHQEYLGSPIRQLYEYWVLNIRDPETGLATYDGKIGFGTNQLFYSSMNHTAEMLYIVTDPSGALGGGQAIDYAVYYTNVFPTKVPQDHLNYSVGDHSATEIDIDFKGVWHRSTAINNLASVYLKKRLVLPTFRSYGDSAAKSPNNGEQIGFSPVGGVPQQNNSNSGNL